MHFNEAISLCGPPPEEFLIRREPTAQFFTPEGIQNCFQPTIYLNVAKVVAEPIIGIFIGTEARTPLVVCLDRTITTLFGEDKRLFLQFAGRMLR